MWVLHLVYNAMHRQFGASGLQVFQWGSALAGVAYVWIALFLAGELGKNSFQKALLFLFAIAVGTLQFFFGYAEIYAIPALSVFLFIIAGVLYTKNKVGVIVPLVAFALTVSAHLLSIVFLPAILFLLAYRHPKAAGLLQKANVWHLALLTVLTIPAAYILMPLLHQYYLIPWSRPENMPQTTTLFSPEHIWEFLNGQLLAAAAGFFLFVVVLLRMLRSKQSLDSTHWFLALSASFSILSAFITNTVRGSGDWDILAFPAIVCNVWAASAYLGQAKTKAEVSRSQSILVVLLAFNVLSTAAWVGINASDRSIRKIEDMLTGDPGNYYQQTLPAPLSLAFNYETNGLREQALEYFKIAAERYPEDPRTYFNYATRLIEAKQDSLALPYLEYLVTNIPTYPRPYQVLISEYVQSKNYPALFSVINRLFGSYLRNPAYFRSAIPTPDLVSWFTYLLQVERANKNEKAAQMIEQQLAQLH